MIKPIALIVAILILMIDEFVTSIEIKNGLVGKPFVQCLENEVKINLVTEKAFYGRVYAADLEDDSECSKDFFDTVNQRNLTVSFKNGECAMDKYRRPNGVIFAMRFVVSFHGTFVTKADRSFRAMCQFEKDETRDHYEPKNQLFISDISPSDVTNAMTMPTCTYTIRAGTPNGPPLQFAKVGEKIYHVWECDDENYGMLIHSCFVIDSRLQQKYFLLDKAGCAVDPIIQGKIEYNQALTRAQVEVHAYKYLNSTLLNYDCTIELCSQVRGECGQITPPRCFDPFQPNGGYQRKLRRKRDLVEYDYEQLFDTRLGVIASVKVLDIQEESEEDNFKSEVDNLLEELNEPLKDNWNNEVETQRTCEVSKWHTYLLLFLSTFCSVFLVTLLMCEVRSKFIGKYDVNY